MPMSLEPPKPRSPKRKPSARAPWEAAEIPVILDSLKGRYRVRNQALVACNVIWGLRAHEALDVRIGDILNADGSFKDGFTMEGARLKGGKPRKPWTPKPKPKGHGKVCPCNLCHPKEPKRSAPEIRHLPILPEMHRFLTAWLNELRARVGELTPDLYIWLSRKRHKAADGALSWRPLSRQSVGTSLPRHASWRKPSCPTFAGPTTVAIAAERPWPAASMTSKRHSISLAIKAPPRRRAIASPIPSWRDNRP
jgi:hypothetical protein